MTELKSTLRNSSQISASSRRLKTWKCWEWRCLQNEVGCWEYSWDYKLFILFVLHEECFCFEGRVVDLKFPIDLPLRAWSLFLIRSPGIILYIPTREFALGDMLGGLRQIYKVRVNLSALIYLNLVICVQKLYPKLKVSETSRKPTNNINQYQSIPRRPTSRNTYLRGFCSM